MKVQTSLLNPEFEGYKLSLDNVPSYMSKLPEPIEPRNQADDQVRFFLFFDREHVGKVDLGVA